MIPERYRDFLSEISGKFPIGNFGKLPRPIPSHRWQQQQQPQQQQTCSRSVRRRSRAALSLATKASMSLSKCRAKSASCRCSSAMNSFMAVRAPPAPPCSALSPTSVPSTPTSDLAARRRATSSSPTSSRLVDSRGGPPGECVTAGGGWPPLPLHPGSRDITPTICRRKKLN